MSLESPSNTTWPDDPEAAIAHMKRHVTVQPNTFLRYEFLSNAMCWSDEMSPDSFSGTMGVLMLIAHRQCLINGRHSGLAAWWDYAQSRCPQWIGFLPERQQFTAEQTAQLEAARKDAPAQWQRHLRPPAE